MQPDTPSDSPPSSLRSRLRRVAGRSPYEPYTGSAETDEASKPTRGGKGAKHEAGAGEVGYSGKRAADIVGITYRQLDYWARTDLVRPAVADVHGTGSRRRYSYRKLIELKLVKTLLDHGIKLTRAPSHTASVPA